MKRESLAEDFADEKKKPMKATTSRQRIPLSAKGSQNTMKSKSVSEDCADEKKTPMKATTSRQCQPLSAKESQNTMKSISVSENCENKTKTVIEQVQSSEILCGICFDSMKDSDMFSNGSCNHPFCTSCISKYVDLQRKINAVKVNCPKPECSVELKPEHFQSMLPKQVIVEWESAIYESSIGMMQKIYCPYKNCSLLLVNDGVEVVTSCECPSCHRLFCAQCKVPWHTNMSCHEFKDSDIGQGEKQLDRNFLELAEREKWQRCPKCSMHVQRTHGCEHMRCRCGCHFCYMCGRDWNLLHTCDQHLRSPDACFVFVILFVAFLWICLISIITH